jgi:hypothetical protein
VNPLEGKVLQDCCYLKVEIPCKLLKVVSR